LPIAVSPLSLDWKAVLAICLIVFVAAPSLTIFSLARLGMLEQFYPRKAGGGFMWQRLFIAVVGATAGLGGAYLLSR
jgi:hypothetical protein